MSSDIIIIIGLLVLVFCLTLFFTINRSLVAENYRKGIVPGFLTFFILTVCISAPLSLANIIGAYFEGYAGEFFFVDILFGILYCILGYLLVRSLLQRDGNALFLAYGYLAICLMSNLASTFYLENFPYKSLIYCVVFGLYFSFSSSINEYITPESRYIKKTDQYIIGALLLYIVFDLYVLYYYYGL